MSGVEEKMKPTFEGMKCEEAATGFPNMYVPCSKPAEAVVFHSRDKRAYLMCWPCAWHNVRNRGGHLVASQLSKFYLSVNRAGIYVKEGDFFEAQGGLTEEWGKAWEPVWARDLHDARVQGTQLRRQRWPDAPRSVSEAE